MNAFTRLCIVPALFLLGTAAAEADITWTQTDTHTGGSAMEIRQTIAVSGERFAISTDQGMRIVMDIPNDRILMINTDEQAYMESSISELDRQVADIQADTNRMLADALKDVPAAQRAQIEAMMKQQMAAMEPDETDMAVDLDYEPTGKSDTIAGYTAREYQAQDVDGTEHRLWCSTDIDISELTAFYEGIRGIEMFRDMEESAQALSFGFPLKSVTKSDDDTMTSEVTDISYDAVDSALFDIPEGYTKRAGMFPGGR